jgi:hypothetical protein
MSYHLSVRRSTDRAGAIGEAELRDKLPHVRGFQSIEDGGRYVTFHFRPAGLGPIGVHWVNGELWAERVEPQHVPFLAALAAELNAQLIGDEGEVYSVTGAIASWPVRERDPLKGLKQFVRRNTVTIIVLSLFLAAALSMRLAGI